MVGYADPESPAGRLKKTPPGGTVILNSKRPPLTLNCGVHVFDFSAHSDREAIRRYARTIAPNRIILVHGESPALEWFRKTLSEDLPATDVRIARHGEPIPLD